MKNVEIINVADLQDPGDKQGRSYRQVNAEREHAIPVGALVEVVKDERDDYEGGVRAWVVWHGRDCDKTPLYWISLDRDDTEKSNSIYSNRGWDGGYSDDGLTVIEENEEES